MKHELEILHIEMQQCKKCELHKTRANVISGGGNTNAKLFIISEAPNYEEDIQGVPFAGRSGQLIENILTACGFNKDTDIYYTNIIKCRPPENRIPTLDERTKCLPFLLKQIELINPKIIVLLGNTALQSFINPALKISKERGIWRTWRNCFIMPTFHPSAIIKTPELKKFIWEDFTKVVTKYRQIINPQHSSSYC